MKPIFLVEMETGKVGETERTTMPVRFARSYKNAMEFARQETAKSAETLKKQGFKVAFIGENYVIYNNSHNEEMIAKYGVTTVAAIGM